MEIKELLRQITNTCKEQMTSGNWGKNEAMRYAYVTLGKELSKSARFFFSIEGKYGEHGLSVEEMKQIHYADSGYEVTCYVSAKMLKDIFSELGIESHIMQSEFSRPYVSDGEVLDIYHSYLLCTGNNDQKYFLSLNSDLVNIKLNAAPEHFAVKIPYIYNGKQSYQGPEIEHSSLTPDELLELDKKIGYAIPIHNPYKNETMYVYSTNDAKHDIYGRQKEPYDYLFSQLANLDQGFANGYEDLFESFKNSNGETKTNFSELTLQEIRTVEWYVFSRCLDLVKSTFQVEGDHQERFFKLFDSLNLDIPALKAEMSKFIRETINLEGINLKKNTQINPFRTLSTGINLINYIEMLSDPSRKKAQTEKDRTNLRALYLEAKREVSKLFLSQEKLNLYIGDKNPTNEFVVYKILNSMETDFECSTSKVCGYRPVFSTKMQAVEQAKFLKDYLRNLLKLEFPTDKDFQARIMFSTLSELNNPDKNAFLIYVKTKDNETTEPSYSMIYNPESNTIELASILAIRQKYKILSKTLSEQVSRPPVSKPKQPNDE